jgi:hypothetical protein
VGKKFGFVVDRVSVMDGKILVLQHIKQAVQGRTAFFILQYILNQEALCAKGL